MLLQRLLLRPALIALCSALVCAPLAFAQDTDDEPMYHVEVILLAHNEPFAAGERFNLDDSLFTDSTFTDMDDTLAAPPEPLPLGNFELLGADELQLGETARRLTNATRFRVLGHLGWRQSVQDTAEQPAKGVAGSDSDGRVSGRITLSRSRFLRLDANLSFDVDGQMVELNQTRRRVRFNKLHYLDHPYFGVIIQVSRAP
ncbi:MAG: CsiV family protein [Gammaproteobacteria bacterium]